MPVSLSHLTLRDTKEEDINSDALQSSARHRTCGADLTGTPYLQLLRLSSHFQQLCDGVHEPLEVMVAHLLDLSVMVPDPSIQLLHEQAMLLTIVHRPEDEQEEKKEKTAGKKDCKIFCLFIFKVI